MGMVNQEYRDATTKMEQTGVDADYVLGWQSGYLGHPKREEQRLTEAYEAGFEDGQAHNLNNFANWAKK